MRSAALSRWEEHKRDPLERIVQVVTTAAQQQYFQQGLTYCACWLQVHIGLGKSNTDMHISWKTRGSR